MAYLPELPEWTDGVYQLEKSDPVRGGVDGPANRPLIDLLKRTAWLKQRYEEAFSGLGWAELGEWAVGLEVKTPSQIVHYQGYWYRYGGSLPHTITGASPSLDDNDNWFNLGNDVSLRANLGSDEGGLLVNLKQGVNVQEAVNHSFSRNTYYVENYISKSYLEDWAEKLQALIDADPTGIFVMPEACSISKTIHYYSSTTIKGRSWGRRSVVGILPDFTGIAAFAPITTKKQSVQSSRIEGLLIRDRGATNDQVILADGSVVNGRGTTSEIHGIDITGTFGAVVSDIVGVFINSIVYAGPGDESTDQTTQRPFIEKLDASNCNHIIYFPGRTDNYFSYGDIMMSNIKTTGSVKYGMTILDTDGLQITNMIGFASCQIKTNGNFIKILSAHPFDPKAQISENADSGVTAESIYIPARRGGAVSNSVELIGVTSINAGRLADTTSGRPAANNVGAWGIRAEKVNDLQLFGDIKDPSMGGLHLTSCVRVHGTLNIRRVNTQQLGSGSLPSGTYSSLYIDGCSFVDINVNDMSPQRNYFLESYNSYMVKLRGRVGRGATLGRFYYIQDSRRYHDIEMFEEGESSYTLRSLGGPSFYPYTADINSTAPANAPSLNGILIQINNTADTSVTDIPSVLANQHVYVNIRDNGATKLRNNTGGGGGLFSGIDDYTKGRGTILHFMRDPDNGLLVKI